METQTTPQAVRRQHGVSRFKGFALTPEDEPLIAKLPVEQQQAIRATGTIEQIAAQLHIPEGTVKSRIHRAKVAITTMRAAAAGKAS